MSVNRRTFLSGAIAAGAAAAAPTEAGREETLEMLDRVAAKPVFKKELFPDPVIIESVELLRHEDNFICRVRSAGGAEGHCVSNNYQMLYLYPISTERVNPFFIGKDARDLDGLIEGVYLHRNNYKLQNLALWVPVATVEFAILDMMGKIAGKPMGALVGDVLHKKVAVYQANNHRGKSAEESIELIKKTASESMAKAVKFKIGGRMLAPDEPAGRTGRLIPLVREAFPEGYEIYADANGAYDAKEAIRIGRLLEEYKIDFFEGPVPFDWYEDIKTVADALTIPLAGGGQEPSMRNYRWLISHKAFQIVQPDMFYFGGMVRCMRATRMSAAMGLTCTPHVSGSGLGYLYMMHFVSATSNAGKFHEFKGLSPNVPFECPTSSLKSEDGVFTVPTGPGAGVTLDPDFVRKHVAV